MHFPLDAYYGVLQKSTPVLHNQNLKVPNNHKMNLKISIFSQFCTDSLVAIKMNKYAAHNC